MRRNANSKNNTLFKKSTRKRIPGKNTNRRTSKKVNYRRGIMLFLILFIAFMLVEIGFILYYNVSGKEVGASDDEACMKEYYNSMTNSSNFDKFRRMGYHDDHPVIGITMKPGFVNDKIYPLDTGAGDSKRVVYYYHHNYQGMRGLKDFSVEKPKGTLRIAMFGDSFTYGQDVPLKLGMSNLLQEIIPNSEVLNFGVPGKSTDINVSKVCF